MRMNEHDLLYLAKNLAQLLGMPARIYRGRERIWFYSTASIPKDPFLLHLEELEKPGPNLSYFTGSDFFYYVIERCDEYRLIVGPFRYFPAEKQSLMQLAFDLDVDKNDVTSFVDGMSSINCMPLEAVLQSMTTLNFVLNGEELGLEDVIIAPSVQKEIVQKRDEAKMEPGMITKERNSTLLIEQTIAHFVKNGDLDGFDAWIKAAPSIRAGSLSSDYMRHEKNTFIVAATIASRAAIEGGLDYNLAMDLSEEYIRQCETVKLYPEISNLNYRMVRHFIRAVSEIRSVSSPLESKVANYVYHHLSEPIALDDLCAALFMAKSNLCLRFKQETGTTVSRFVLTKKIEECTRLLQTTEKPISAIAGYLGFSSPSHLTKTYKSLTGMNPNDVRRGKKAKEGEASQPLIYVSSLRPLGEAPVFEKALGLLSPAQKAKALAYRLEEDKIRSVGSQLLLSHAMKKEGIDLQKETMLYGANGKPYLASSKKEFNLSHSGSFAAVGIDGTPIGVDVQIIKNLRPAVLRLFNASERATIESSSSPSSSFHKLWSAKEALSKRTGLGLKKPIDSSNLSELVEKDAIEIEENGVTVHLVCFDLGGAWLSVASEVPVDQFVLVPFLSCLKKTRLEWASHRANARWARLGYNRTL